MMELAGPSREQGHEVRWKTCPSCARDYWVVSQNMDTGAWVCYGCGARGAEDTGISGSSLLARLTPTPSSHEWGEAQLPEWRPLSRTARKYLRNRGIEKPEDFGLVETAEGGRIVFPYFGPDGMIVYWTTRYIVDDGLPKYVGAPGRKPPYVLPEWRSYDEEVVFVEGPVDCIMHYLATGKPTIALGGTSLPNYLSGDIDYLARGGRVLMLDHDALHRALTLGQQLGAQLHRLPKGEDPGSYYKGRIK